LVDGMINAAANLRRSVPLADPGNVSALFARPLFDGILSHVPPAAGAS
jgi:hypothetical protein